MSEDTALQSRRPIKMRGASWVNALASGLANRGISPNAISLSSVFFAILGCIALVTTCYFAQHVYQTSAFLFAAGCIQCRLLANLLDGMVAVEGGLGGPLGDVYNEFPDRFADVILILPVGYIASQAPWPLGTELGWTACCLALLTAYVRALGASINKVQAFHGPMAKPHRMFLLTIAFIAASIGVYGGYSAHILFGTLLIMNIGMLITIYRRLRFITATLKVNNKSTSGHL